MEVFYKGADIEIELSLFEDSTQSKPANLSEFAVDAVLYSNQSEIIRLTSGADDGIKLIITGSGTMCAVIDRAKLLPLTCGVVHIDIRLVNSQSGLSVVDTSAAFVLEDSVIKNI